jgi:UDP-galactopyranose mutase
MNHLPANLFDVQLRLSRRWVGGNIGSTDATITYHNLNAHIFETNNRTVINNKSLYSL